MTVQQFIEKAIEGGWRFDQIPHIWSDNLVSYQVDEDTSKDLSAAEIILDPLAWQAVGKVEGWQDVQAGYRESDGLILYESGWKRRMHRMIDALAEGKTIEQYLETL